MKTHVATTLAAIATFGLGLAIFVFFSLLDTYFEHRENVSPENRWVVGVALVVVMIVIAFGTYYVMFLAPQ